MLLVLNKEKKDKIKLIEDMEIAELKLLISNYGSVNKLDIQKFIEEEEKKITEEMETQSLHEEISKWRSQGKLKFREVKDDDYTPNYYKHDNTIEDDSRLKDIAETVEKTIKDNATCGEVKTTHKKELNKSYNFGRYGDPEKTSLIEDPSLREIAETVEKTIKDNAMQVNKVNAAQIRSHKLYKFQSDMIKAIHTNFKDLAKVYCKMVEDDKESSSEQIANNLVKGILNEV